MTDNLSEDNRKIGILGGGQLAMMMTEQQKKWVINYMY